MAEPIGQKTQRNIRVAARYAELMTAGKHGFYESVFQVVREEVDRERERCAQIADSAVNDANGQRKAGMARAIARRIRHDAKPDDNYEPPDPPGWEGGFASNH